MADDIDNHINSPPHCCDCCRAGFYLSGSSQLCYRDRRDCPYARDAE